MKRYLSVLFVFVLLLSMLAGCGAKEEADDDLKDYDFDEEEA